MNVPGVDPLSGETTEPTGPAEPVATCPITAPIETLQRRDSGAQMPVRFFDGLSSVDASDGRGLA